MSDADKTHQWASVMAAYVGFVISSPDVPEDVRGGLFEILEQAPSSVLTDAEKHQQVVLKLAAALS